MPHQPFPLDVLLEVDPVVPGHQQHVTQHVGQLGTEPVVQLLLGVPLGSGLAGPHQERLRQLADLLLELEEEPRLVPREPVCVGITSRHRLDVVAQPRQVHRYSPGTDAVSASTGRTTPKPTWSFQPPTAPGCSAVRSIRIITWWASSSGRWWRTSAASPAT